MNKYKTLLLTTFLSINSLSVFGSSEAFSVRMISFPPSYIQQVLSSPATDLTSAIDDFKRLLASSQEKKDSDQKLLALPPELMLHSMKYITLTDLVKFLPALVNLMEKALPLNLGYRRSQIFEILNNMNIKLCVHLTQRQDLSRITYPLQSSLIHPFSQSSSKILHWTDKLLREIDSEELMPLLEFFFSKYADDNQLSLLNLFMENQSNYNAGMPGKIALEALDRFLPLFMSHLSEESQMKDFAKLILLKHQWQNYLDKNIEKFKTYFSPKLREIIILELKKLISSERLDGFYYQNLMDFLRNYGFSEQHPDVVQKIQNRQVIKNSLYPANAGANIASNNTIPGGNTEVTRAVDPENMQLYMQDIALVPPFIIHEIEPLYSSHTYSSNEEGLDQYCILAGNPIEISINEIRPYLQQFMLFLLDDESIRFGLIQIMTGFSDLFTKEFISHISQMNINPSVLMDLYVCALKHSGPKLKNKMLVAEEILKINPSKVKTVVDGFYLSVAQDSKVSSFQRQRAADAIRDLGPAHHEAAKKAYLSILKGASTAIQTKKNVIEELLKMDPSFKETIIEICADLVENREGSDYQKLQFLPLLVKFDPAYLEKARVLCNSIKKSRKNHQNNRVRAERLLERLNQI